MRRAQARLTSTTKVCQSNGVPINHLARVVRPSDFSSFDYIFAMECVAADSTNNLRNLRKMQPAGTKAKCVIVLTQGAPLLRVVRMRLTSDDKGTVWDPYYVRPLLTRLETRRSTPSLSSASGTHTV